MLVPNIPRSKHTMSNLEILEGQKVTILSLWNLLKNSTQIRVIVILTLKLTLSFNSLKPRNTVSYKEKYLLIYKLFQRLEASTQSFSWPSPNLLVHWGTFKRNINFQSIQMACLQGPKVSNRWVKWRNRSAKISIFLWVLNL